MKRHIRNYKKRSWSISPLYSSYKGERSVKIKEKVVTKYKRRAEFFRLKPETSSYGRKKLIDPTTPFRGDPLLNVIYESYLTFTDRLTIELREQSMTQFWLR